MKPLRLAMQVALSLRRSRRASSPLMTGSSSRYCPNPVVTRTHVQTAPILSLNFRCGRITIDDLRYFV